MRSASVISCGDIFLQTERRCLCGVPFFAHASHVVLNRIDFETQELMIQFSHRPREPRRGMGAVDQRAERRGERFRWRGRRRQTLAGGGVFELVAIPPPLLRGVVLDGTCHGDIRSVGGDRQRHARVGDVLQHAAIPLPLRLRDQWVTVAGGDVIV